MSSADRASLLPNDAELERALVSVYEYALETPVVEVPVHGVEARLKLECLQPTGSFKIRGATASIRSRAETSGPVVTISAGNMARAAAYVASREGRPFIAYVPDHAPAAKLDPIRELGGTIRPTPFADWWSLVTSTQSPVPDALFVHPFADPDVMAGNATIAAELVYQTDSDVVLVPWGGGGLALGIAHALRRLRPEAEVYAVEVSTAAPLAASFAAGRSEVVEYVPTFVDGIGSPEVIPAIWPLAPKLIAGVVTVTPDHAASGVAFAARYGHVVAEGAAGCAVAALQDPRFDGRRVTALVSGGNIDLAKAAELLAR